MTDDLDTRLRQMADRLPPAVEVEARRLATPSQPRRNRLARSRAADEQRDGKLTRPIALLSDAKVSAVMRPLLWITAAVTALLVVPVTYWAATTYGASYLLWDAHHSSYYYDERPGGFAVIVTGLVLCALMTIFAAVAVARAALLMTRRYGPKRRAVA